MRTYFDMNNPETNYLITLNGKQVEYVYWADPEAGEVCLKEVDYCPSQKAGCALFIRDEEDPSGCRTLVCKGKVELARRETAYQGSAKVYYQAIKESLKIFIGPGSVKLLVDGTLFPYLTPSGSPGYWYSATKVEVVSENCVGFFFLPDESNLPIVLTVYRPGCILESDELAIVPNDPDPNNPNHMEDFVTFVKSTLNLQ